MRRRQSKLVPFALVGIAPDQLPALMAGDAYSAAANMRVTPAGMQRADGSVPFVPAVGPTGVAPKWCMLYIDANTPMVLFAGAAGVVRSDGNTHLSVTPSSGWTDFNAGEMTSGVLNGIPVFNAPNMPPWYLDMSGGTDIVKPLPNWLAGSAANVLAPFNQHLFAGSVLGASLDYERLAWSDVAGPGTVPATWTPTATNQAGDLNLGVGIGPVMAMRGLGPQLMVYRASGCWAVQYVGRPYIYTARKVSSDVGAATRNSVADVMGQHVVLSPGDMIITDGTNARSIGEGRVKSTLFGQISDDGLTRCHVYAVPGANEVVFALAIGRDDACNLAYVWNTVRDKWSVRELPLTTAADIGLVPINAPILRWDADAGSWDTDFDPWDAPPAGGFKPEVISASPNNSQLYTLDKGNTRFDGSNIAASLERTGIALDDSPGVKHVFGLYPAIDGTPGDVVSVQIGTQMAPDAPVTWLTAEPYTIGTSRRVDKLAQGKYFGVRFSATNVGRWSVGGFAFEYAERGQV